MVAEAMYKWGGGRDLLLDFGKAFQFSKEKQNKDLEVTLFIPHKSWLRCFVLDFWDYKKKSLEKFKLKRYYENKESEKTLIDNFREYCPSIAICYYVRLKIGSFNTKSSLLNLAFKRKHIDVSLWAPYVEGDKLCVPNIVYIPDFQHKYYPKYFDMVEIQSRDIYFENIVMNVKHVMVTSYDTAKDIKKFYPQHKCGVYVQPFAPICVDGWIKKQDFSEISTKYKIPRKYFMISNQFWQHKNHLIAFQALEHLYIKGYTDLCIVCTGKMEDYRNEKYINDLLYKVSSMKCRENILFLGYIPKNDQIQILKNSIALIQPTEFEGNPGGNSVLDACSVGIPCILSDIPVNKEIANRPENEIVFFETANEKDLMNKMLYMLKNGNKIEDEQILEERMLENKKILVNSIFSYFDIMIDEKSKNEI